MNSGRKRLKKSRLLVICGAAAAIAILCIIFILLPAISSEPEAPAALPAQELTPAPMYKSIADAVFSDAAGNEARISTGTSPAVILYWASWCPDCKELMPRLNEVAELVGSAGGELYLIDRLEKDRESIEAAEAELNANGIQLSTLYDVDRKVYDSLGLTMIPTVIVTAPDGTVSAVSRGSLPEDDSLLSMLVEAVQGKAKCLFSFMEKEMTAPSGGIITEYDAPDGDMLSESQGVFLLYAAKTQNDEFFDSLYSYVNAHLAGGALASWSVGSEGDSGVNALIDDLRIVNALSIAHGRRGGLKAELKAYSQAIYTYNTVNDRLVDFYDFSALKPADRLTLCYADFSTLDILSELDERFKAVRDDALMTVQNGFISNAFPLYYSYYDYKRGVYPRDDLNMAEALTTLLHLSQAGKLEPVTLDWLRARMNEGYLWAGYDVRGNPTSSGRFESTSVYALLARIALCEGDYDLASLAIERMENMKIRNADSRFDCAFGNPDGTGIHAFDQGMALLAYEAYGSAVSGSQ